MSGTLQRLVIEELNVIRRRQSSPSIWRSFSPQEWNQTLTWLDLSGLAIYFLQRMKSSPGLETLPEWVVAELEKRSAANRVRSAEIVEEFRTIIEAFERSGVKYAVLKGVSLLPDYCPELELRTQYDHDVLVAPESLEAARCSLEEAGFQPKGKGSEQAPLVYRKDEPEIRFTNNSEALYSPRLGRSIELHQLLWEDEEERIHVNLFDDFLERRLRRQWQGIPFMALSDEDCLLFQVLHAFKHILRNWCRLSIFLEVAVFLNSRQSDSAFWRRFAARIENVRWAREATFIVVTLAEQLFGGPISASLRNSLKCPLSPALSLWIERYGTHSALSNFHDDKHSLFLYREFVDDPSDWKIIQRRRLFPMHRPHRPPAVVFQRGFSALGRIWMEKVHAFRRLRFHGLAGFRYVLEYPRWIVLRRLRLADSGGS
jgi:hypothetical protein